MPLGVQVNTSEAPQASGVPTSTGMAFMVGLADQGPLTPTLVHSINDYVTVYGPRSTTSSVLYDSVDVYFREGGAAAYIARVSDNTATSAALTLQDAAPHPTVVVTAATPGVDGNQTEVAVTTANAATFTANTTSASPNLANISSFANIGVGTPISGTGIPAGTYILSVNTGAGTAVMTANASATATGVTITPTKFTVLVEDTAGDILETHGPYTTTAQLFADNSSALVTFTQSAGSGFTTNAPSAIAATALTGGANASDITDTSYVNALAAFPATLGPGQVLAPGRTSATVWTGLLAHAQANNRVAHLGLTDQPTAAALISQISSVTNATNASYGFITASSVVVPGINPLQSRTVPGGPVWAALCARVSQTGNDNQAPAGVGWPLQYVTGFTNVFNAADTQTLNNAGINTWAIRDNTPCLFGFSSPVPQASDAIFWQASASRERMALVADCQAAAEPFLFDILDGRGLAIAKFTGVLQGIIADHWADNALFGVNATDAGTVNASAPINTAATEQAGQLNAALNVRISPFAQAITINVVVTPISQAV